MRREWTPEDLIASWTLVEADWRLVGNKSGATRLGFTLLLKFFEEEGRFPRHGAELPRQAVDYVAEQLGLSPALMATYAWTGRTIEYHRAQIRAALDFRETTLKDEERLSGWLAEEVCPNELGEERQRAVGVCAAGDHAGSAVSRRTGDAHDLRERGRPAPADPVRWLGWYR